MGILFELRRRARHVVWPALAICVLLYMAYHIVHGDRGLLAWRALKERLAHTKVELAEAEAERALYARWVELLHPDRIDRDMLDEWARRQLNYGHPDDLVIMTEPAETVRPTSGR